MKKLLVIMIVAIAAVSCGGRFAGNRYVKPFLKDYYREDIHIVSATRLDSLYWPAEDYRQIGQAYSNLNPADTVWEKELYGLYQKASIGKKNEKGLTVKYRRGDDPAVLEDTFIIDSAGVSSWGPDVAFLKQRIESKHTRYINGK